MNWESMDPALAAAAFEPLLVDERRARINGTLAARLGGLRVVLENLHDPHNGAAVLRSCEAFGLQYVHVVETVEPFRFASSVTVGCEKWMDIVRHPTVDDCAEALKREGFALYAAVPGATKTLDDLDFSRPAALMLGNEHAGLSSAAVAIADETFGIPLFGMTRSFNLSVATALATERAAQHRRRAVGHDGDLDEQTILRLRARFYSYDVRSPDQVMARYLSDRA